MTPYPALDAAIRQAGHLLFAFDGPICRVDDGKPADSTASPAPYMYEVLAACRESGRSVVVISTKPKIDVPTYLDAHDLFTQVTVIAASLADAINFLGVTPESCILITSSAADIKAAHAAGTSSIAYARTSDDAAHLVSAGATMSVYSMADLVLTLRA